MHNEFCEPNVTQTVEKDFSKRFVLKCPNDTEWQLPPSSHLFDSVDWQDAELMLSKQELNSKKCELNDLELKRWHQHTRNTNHAGLVVPTIRKRIDPEFLTQAWCKFYEMACSYKLIPDICRATREFNTVHLCEAPGAFITSLNHYLTLNYPEIKWHWLGTTLNPHYEGNELGQMLNDDRLILHVMDNWWFGIDNTGNLFSPKNAAAFLEYRRTFSPVNLVTCDGSIDCQNDPGEQEGLVSPLHYCETLVALGLLAPRGNLVIKMFTTLETSSVCLLYLLCCVFQHVNVYKPATSKEGNSEVYVICQDYVGRHQVSENNERGSLLLSETLTVLMRFYGENITAKGPLFRREDIPDLFMKRLRNCSNFFKDLQITVLDRNLRLFKGSHVAEMNFTNKVRWILANEFILRYGLLPIPQECQLVGNSIIRKWESGKCMDGRDEEGTFTERCEMKTEGVEIWVSRTKALLESNIFFWQQSGHELWFDSSVFLRTDLRRKKGITVGKQVTVVHSSKFCLGKVLKVWNRMLSFFGRSPPLKPSNYIKEIDGKIVEICSLESIEGGWWKDTWSCLCEAVCLVYRYLAVMSAGESFLLTGLPLVTRLAVSLLHLIGSRFTKVALCNPEVYGYAVIFSQLNDKESLMSDLQYIKDTYFYKPDGYTLHSVFCITQLCSGSLYETIMDINHIYMSFNSLLLANKILISNSPSALHH